MSGAMNPNSDNLARAIVALGREFYGEPLGPVVILLPQIIESLIALTVDPSSVFGGVGLVTEMRSQSPRQQEREL